MRRNLVIIAVCTKLVLAAGLASVPVLLAQASYRRADWPHWIGRCPDVRQQVLRAESVEPPTISADGCRVVSGAWLSYIDGERVTDPMMLDIDHLVPLANAHRSGAAGGSRERKRAYANDLVDSEHLVAVTAQSNRSKGDQGPEAWRPPRSEAHCKYGAAWALVKLRWGLKATEAELIALREMIATCPR